MAVTPTQVREVFEASQATSTIEDATDALANGLAPLFNQAAEPGDTFTPYSFSQNSAATPWGPIPNPAGRPPIGLQIYDRAGVAVLIRTYSTDDWATFFITPSRPMAGDVYWS